MLQFVPQRFNRKWVGVLISNLVHSSSVVLTPTSTCVTRIPCANAYNPLAQEGHANFGVYSLENQGFKMLQLKTRL